MNLPSPDDLIETFGLLPDWEARYAYLIDLGRALPEMDEALKTDAVLVPGCTSRVWLVATQNSPLPLWEREGPKAKPWEGEGEKNDNNAPSPVTPSACHPLPQGERESAAPLSSTFHFHIASDAAIVQGLCAVVMVFVQGRTADQIRATDMHAIFEKLHLAGNLSPNRRNGFFAMMDRIKQLVG